MSSLETLQQSAAPAGVIELLLRAAAGDEPSVSVTMAAIAIADEAARCDVEIYGRATKVDENGGYTVFSTTELGDFGRGSLNDTHADALEALAKCQRAVAYIWLRGNNFPWRLIEADQQRFPGCVRFVDKEGRPVGRGEQA